MASLISIPIHADKRGSLAVIQDECPFEIKRIFFIFDVPEAEVRGNHGHIKNRMLLSAIKGSCSIYCNNGVEKKTIVLNTSSIGLLLNPEDWHSLRNFTQDCVLVALCSEPYAQNDYFYEEPHDQV